MTKRKIPSPIKRQLRQEAGFGCCKCGSPILEFHHMVPWSKVKRHNLQDMMALCPTCHYSIDSYSQENQRKFKKKPFNLINPNPSGFLVVSQDICAISTGSITLLGDGPIVTSNKTVYLSAFLNEDNIFEISLKLFNKYKKLLLEIDRNEWIKGNIELWDIEFTSASKILRIREKKGKVNLEVDAGKIPVCIQGEFWIENIFVSFTHKGINVGGINILEVDKNSDQKFGNNHFFENSIKLCVNANSKENAVDHSTKNSSSVAKLSGSSKYSGCYIEIDPESTSLTLSPKPQPFNFEAYEKKDPRIAELLLKQQLNTQKYFLAENTTFWECISDPLGKGMEVRNSELALIPFIQKLARYYVAINEIEKSLKQYEKILEIQHAFYGKPNLEQGETFFELSKLLFGVGNTDDAKEIYKEAVICFLSNNHTLPFRLLDFSKALFKENEPCFCRSNIRYSHCHMRQSELSIFIPPIETKISLEGLATGSKISLFFLKDHNLSHFDDYKKNYDLVFQDFNGIVRDFYFNHTLRLEQNVSKLIKESLTDLKFLDEEGCLTREIIPAFKLGIPNLPTNLKLYEKDILKVLEPKISQSFRDKWEYSISITQEIPIIIQVLEYGMLPIVVETVLRQGGIFLKFAKSY